MKSLNIKNIMTLANALTVCQFRHIFITNKLSVIQKHTATSAMRIYVINSKNKPLFLTKPHNQMFSVSFCMCSSCDRSRSREQ